MPGAVCQPFAINALGVMPGQQLDAAYEAFSVTPGSGAFKHNLIHQAIHRREKKYLQQAIMR
jgi:hypothetical protein